MKNIIIATAVATIGFTASAFAQTPAYTIETRSAGEQVTENASTSVTANTNTNAADVNDTIAANPGLAEALEKEGIMTSEIGAISILPNDKVVVFKK